MTIRFLIYCTMFVFEWAFGNKAHKQKDKGDLEEPTDSEKTNIKRWLISVIRNFNKSRKFASIIILFLCISLAANFHLISKISTMLRERSEEQITKRGEKVSGPTSNTGQEYYNRLSDHFKNTYSE